MTNTPRSTAAVQLDPFIAAVLKSMNDAGAPVLSSLGVEGARAMVASGRAALGVGPDMARTSNLDIPVRHGMLPARLHEPAGARDAVIVFCHGGGWVVAELDDYDGFGRRLAQASGCAVLMPDYRLAPEYPFPAAIEDVEDVLIWTAATLCGEGKKLILAGDSAGGNLVTVAAHRLRGKVAPALQVLIYPVTDCDFESGSYRSFGEGFMLTAADMKWFFDHYATQAQRITPDVSPIRSTDLSGMPPAFVMTAQCDPLRDEGEAYARKLAEAGVKVRYEDWPGMTHGFIRLHNLDAGIDAAVQKIAAAIDDAITGQF